MHFDFPRKPGRRSTHFHQQFQTQVKKKIGKVFLGHTSTVFENHTKISHLAKITSAARKMRVFEEFSNTVDQKKGVPKSDEKEKVMHILVSCSVFPW